MLSDLYRISTQYLLTGLIANVLYVDKPEPMILVNYILIKIVLEIIYRKIESPDRHRHMVTSLSGVGYPMENRPVWNKRKLLNSMAMADEPAEWETGVKKAIQIWED